MSKIMSRRQPTRDEMAGSLEAAFIVSENVAWMQIPEDKLLERAVAWAKRDKNNLRQVALLLKANIEGA